MGRLSQTKYPLLNSSSKTTIIRRHHPLINQELPLLSVGKKTVVVRTRQARVERDQWRVKVQALQDPPFISMI